MITALWLEDDKNVIETVCTKLEELSLGTKINLTIKKNFTEAAPLIEATDFDVIILDLREGTNDEKGLDFFRDNVWGKNFCPVIFYSAFNAKAIDEKVKKIDHKLVHKLPKDNGPKALLDKIAEVADLVSFSKEFMKELKVAKSFTLQEFYAKCEGKYSPDDIRKIAKGTLGRRLSALVDYNIHKDDKKLLPFEMYIWPPLSGTSMMTGDLLRDANGELFMVLTPSCDMVRLTGTFKREPKVKDVLLAKCFKINQFLSKNFIHRKFLHIILDIYTKIYKLTDDMNNIFNIFLLPALMCEFISIIRIIYSKIYNLVENGFIFSIEII